MTVDATARAASILEAWLRKDRRQFRAELDQAASARPDDERGELLEGVAEELRRLEERGGMAEADVYLRLLQHLAS